MLQPHLWVQAAFLIILGGAVGWLVLRSYSANLSQAATLIRLLAIDLFILGACMGAGAWFGSVYPPIFAITATGILTFFYLLYHAIRSAPDTPLQDRDLRIAITGSITTMYLALVGFGVFMRILVPGDAAASREAESPLAQALILSFTSIVGIAIAFYFGTSAYLDGRATGSRSQDESKDESGTDAQPSVAADAPQAARR